MRSQDRKTRLAVWLLAFWVGLSGCSAQEPYGTNQLSLSRTIPLLGVKGRIDHLDVNLKDRIVYVAALGNNTLEVVDLTSGKIIHHIKDLDQPQGIGYIPQSQELIVANGGSGDCYFYNARTFEKVATIHLGSDADDVRYDSATEKIYVGYGNGGVAVIDAVSHRQVGDIKLPAHPESFQFDKSLQRLFVNLPDAHIVGVVDLTQSLLVGKWENSASANFPMAIDRADHRVFVGYRHPARLVVFDGRTGKELASFPMTGDADDLYYDEGSKKVYSSGGQGSISIFQEQDKGIYRQTANIPTRSGARTSLLVPSLEILTIGARAVGGQPACLLVYTIHNGAVIARQ
jgi:DNA-binding beta-propeller fold protein YncE